ncbi:MAG: hypothetical protein M3Y08_00510 [Fibrobacterota bacterium]|nr:hypothetical protein [Fibrobacterota bacterium]
MRTMRTILAAAAIAMAASPTFADSWAFEAEGYWIDNEVQDYERYIRIEKDSGFYCVLDGKSGFFFKVVGDSITTPMNGMNHIAFFPGSGDLQISGEEKGQAYLTRFNFLAPKNYPKQCVDLEKEYSATVGMAAGQVMPMRKSFRSGKAAGWAARNILGRTISGR